MSASREGEESRVRLGAIVKPHGRRGEVRVASHFDPPQDLEEVFLVTESGVAPRRVEGIRSHSGTLLLKIEGVDSRPAAEELRGLEIQVSRDAMPELAPNSFYLEDLMGCRVVTEDGRDLGEVAGFLDGGFNQVLRIQGESGEWLLPAARDIIVEVRLDEKLLRVDPPEGLVDLP